MNCKFLVTIQKAAFREMVFVNAVHKKAWELQREIMQGMISVPREAYNCEDTEQLQFLHNL